LPISWKACLASMKTRPDMSQEAEHGMQVKASRHGQDTAEATAAILADALECESRDLVEAVAGIQRGLDDFKTGRHRIFEEFEAEQRLKHQITPTR
jgi:hypothetical protein